MKYVLDVNMCRNIQLAKLLKENNEIVITSDFLVEVFKSDDSKSMFIKNTRIIKEHPNQIFVTYDKGELVRLEISKKTPLIPDEIIDLNSTNNFRNWLMNENELDKILQLGYLEAKKQVKYQKDFMNEYMYGSTKKLQALLKVENTRKQYLADKAKLLDDIKETSLTVMEGFLRNNNIIDVEDFKRVNSIIYSQNYVLLWRIANWSLLNGIESVGLDKLTHDGFDIKYVFISTFFDDLLTKEHWLRECRLDLINSIG